MLASRVRLIAFIAVAAAAAAACSDPEKLKKEYVENGDRFVKQEKYSEAAVEYRNAIKHDKTYGEARFKLAQTLEKSGNPQAAFGEYVRAADLLPNNTEAQVKAATYLVLSQQWEDAKTRIQRVVDRDPRNVDALIILGTATTGLREFDAAVAQMEQAIAIDPSRGTSYSNLAAVYLARGDKAEAKKIFEHAVSIDQKSVASWMSLANFQISSGSTGDAETSLKRVLALEPKNLLANRALASIYAGTNRADQAEPYMKTLADASEEPAAKFALADFYMRTNRAPDARALLRQMIDAKKDVTGAEIRLARLEYNEKQTAKAQATLDRVLAREPRNSTALVMKADWLARDGKVADALTRAQAAVDADPGSASAHYTLGTLQVRKMDYEAAEKSFSEALRLNPRAAQAELELSRLRLAKGDAATAVQHANAVLERSPGNPVARLALTRGLIARRETARAEAQLSGLLKEYPNAAVVHALNGSFYAMKNDLARARTEYMRALTVDPKLFEAMNGLTLIQLASGNRAAARAFVDTQLKANPNRPELMVLTARVHALDGDLPGAEKLLREAVSLNAADSSAYAMLGQVLVAQKKLNEALTEFDALVKRDARNVSAATMAAMIVEAQKNLPEAKKRYAAILDKNPRAVVAANNLAWLYAEEGTKLDEAIRLAELAISVVPDRAEIHDTLGWIYYRKELPSLAIKHFEQSIAKDGSNPLFHYHLALALAKTGETSKARQSAEMALRLNPGYSDAQKLLDSLKG